MKKIYSLLLLIAISSSLKAQFSETIRTGRPGQAAGSFSVGTYVLQTQTGFDFGGFNEKSADFSGNFFAANTVIRFGITNRFEINSGWELRKDKYDLSGNVSSTNGLSLSSIGTRINIFEGKDAIPAIGIQVTLKLPVLADAYNFKNVAPSIVLAVNEKINDRLGFLLNLGINYSGNDIKPSGTYVANLNYTISAKWGTFIENYGYFSDSNFYNYWDTGLSYLLNNDLQLDIYGGIGNNSGMINHFTSIGISWRFLKLHNKTASERANP